MERLLESRAFEVTLLPDGRAEVEQMINERQELV
jgi:hypothetical protein